MWDRSLPVRGIALREVLPGAQLGPRGNVRVTGCTSDPRICRPGDVFVAQPEGGIEVRAGAELAQRLGAIAVVVGRSFQLTCGLPIVKVADTRAAFARICYALANCPSERLKLVGIGGNHGKTTTAQLVASVLETAECSTAICGSLGAYDGARTIPTPRIATPPFLATWMAESAANGCSHAVLEVSRRAIAGRHLAGLELDVAGITNLRRDRSAGGLLARLAPHGVAVINADDPASIAAADRHSGPMLTVGLDSPAEVRATILEQFPSEQTFLLVSGDESVPVRTNLVGRQNVQHCLVAAGIGIVYGIDLPTIARGLESVTKVPGCLERIECGQPFSLFVDSTRSPRALERCLRELRQVTEGRLVCVLGTGGKQHRMSRLALGRTAETLADLAVITSGNPSSNSRRAIAADLLRGFREPELAEVILDRRDAIRWALDWARPGDCVLLAGNGNQTLESIRDGQLVFDDRQVARQCLWGAPSPDRRLRLAA